MKAKIIHITNVHRRYDIRIFYKQCISLHEDGIGDVSLLVADGKGDEKINGIDIHDIGKPKYGRRLGRMIYGNIMMWKYLLKTKADILHFHDPELLPLAFLIKLFGRVVIFDMHENLPKDIMSKDYIYRPLRRPASFILKVCQGFIFRFIPVVFAENSYPQDFPLVKKSVIVLNYSIIKEMDKVIADKRTKFTVGYFGSISKARGALTQLESIALLRKEGFDIGAIFVGPYSEDVSSASIYHEAIKNGWAIFTGVARPEYGWRKMSECQVGMAILQSYPNFIESYPTKLFEYMVLGIPSIVSDFPIYRAVIEEAKCGILVNPMDVSAVSEAIRWLVENPDGAKEMGKMGRKAALEKFNWNSEFIKLKTFYKSIINIKII